MIPSPSASDRSGSRGTLRHQVCREPPNWATRGPPGVTSELTERGPRRSMGCRRIRGKAAVRVLVVANRTLGGGQVLSKLRELEAHGPIEILVVVPAEPPPDHPWTEGEARRVARERL